MARLKRLAVSTAPVAPPSPALVWLAAATLSLGLAVGCGAPEGRHAASDNAIDTAARTGWTLEVLGIAQDGGIPHLGCEQPLCVSARDGRRRPERVSSLGLVHAESRLTYLFDATPDLPAQIHDLAGTSTPSGIFLTHAHIGHYTGLIYLGKESIGAAGVPVFGTRRMNDYLRSNGPWSLLVADGNITLETLYPDMPIELTHGLRVTPFTVPHRDEFTDTVGYIIAGPRATALYIPDIDRWDRWNRDIRQIVDSVDFAFIDGTFSSPDEINRDLEDIPHPMIPETRERLRDVDAEVWFIHLNHTNPAITDATDVAREGMEFEL